MVLLPQSVAMLSRPAVSLLLAAVLLAPPPVHAQTGAGDGSPPPAKESFEPTSGQAGKDVVWVPTPHEVVEAMLEMADVKAGETVVDLGSGDGRIAIAAAKRGAISTGIEYNPDMVELSQRNAARAGVTTARFLQGDIFQSDFSDADVVTMYLLPTLNERLRPRLLDMKPGTRVASNQFTMGNWRADDRRSVAGREALLWIVPAKVAGRWQVDYRVPDMEGDLRLDLKQEYQDLEAMAIWGSNVATVSDVQLSGGNIRFTVTDGRGGMHRFVGLAGHDGRMSGTVSSGDGRQQSFTATRISASASS